MKDLGFADDKNAPDPDAGSLPTAVHEALEVDGWFRSRLSAGLPSALQTAVTDFLRAWSTGAPKVDWEGVRRAFTFRNERARESGQRRHIFNPRSDLATLFCKLAGIGNEARRFEKAAAEAGLTTDVRSDAMIRALASALSSIAREHIDSVGLPHGLLFDRIIDWPFESGSGPGDWRGVEFRADLERYTELTGFNVSLMDDALVPFLTNRDPGQPQILATWLTIFGPQIGETWFRGRMQRPPNPDRRTDVVNAAQRLHDGLEAWLDLAGHGADFAAAGMQFQDVAALVFGELIATADPKAESDPVFALRRFERGHSAGLRMWFARAGYSGRMERIPADLAQAWLRIVKLELATFRPILETEDKLGTDWEARVKHLLRFMNPTHPALHEPPQEYGSLNRERIELAEQFHDCTLLLPYERFRRDCDHFFACVDWIYESEGLWKGMHQLLLAIRALRSPCVSSDLRYWNEPELPAAKNPRQPDELLCRIPMHLVTQFHRLVAAEQSRDPELESLRGEFALYCLQGLRDSRTDDAATEATPACHGRKTIEPSWAWRYCRVRAAKTLAINPDARGHRLLKLAAESDPDPRVREVANDAYQSLRRGVGLPEGMSPRRAILGAFWWLRQAHLMDLLGEESIDRDGAQRTRIKELSRTKEPKPN